MKLEFIQAIKASERQSNLVEVIQSLNNMLDNLLHEIMVLDEKDETDYNLGAKSIASSLHAQIEAAKRYYTKQLHETKTIL